MRRLGLVLLPIVIAACGSVVPSPSPSPTPAAAGFHLRAWLEQALPPEFTFPNLPLVAIDEGLLIDGNVAVPAIFPGPLVVMPNVRGISDAGQGQIIAEAHQLGLLSGQSDFTGGQLAPGAQSAHIEMVVDGVSYRLVGDPLATASPQPGSPGAFALFWQQLGAIEEWLPDQLGPVGVYAPQRLAVVTMPPEAPTHAEPRQVAWPLEVTFAQLGQPWAMAGSRCATVEGEQLEALLPVLRAATQIDVFVDSADEARTLLVRPLVPAEPTPCGPADE